MPPKKIFLSGPGPIFLAMLAIVLAGWAAYSNSFQGPFIVDDTSSIEENPTIQQGWPAAFHPPAGGFTVSNRPLVNLSLALNYQAGGLSVTGYHVFNLVIHLLAALVLFGLIRRTLELPALRRSFGADALPLALGVALVWVLHPLQTEAVTYVVQRAECLMGLFYLLTLYCFIRGCRVEHRVWLPLSVAACLLGVFCKEVIVTAPLLVLLYDRTFVAGTFDAALRERRKYYAALFATWLPLAWQMGNAGTRGTSAGFGLGVSPLEYALAQGPVIVNYLQLYFWPHPLTQDYGAAFESVGPEAFPSAAIIVMLVAATAWAGWKRPMLGFLGVWFFLVLAPSSSFLPIVTDVAAEHRMYLPLASLVAWAVLTLHQWVGRRALVATMALALALGLLTYERNEDYRTTVRIWRKNTESLPGVAQVRESYGLSLLTAQRLPDAEEELRQALRLKPGDPDYENNLADALAMTGKNAEAVQYFKRAIPGLRTPYSRGFAYFSMGNALRAESQWKPAFDAYTQAVTLRPDFAQAYNNEGGILELTGDFKSAIKAYQAALRADPTFAVGELNLANAYAEDRQLTEALPHYAKAIRENPRNAEAQVRLGNALGSLDRFDDAEKQYAGAESLQPNRADAHFNRGVCLLKLGRVEAAVVEFEATLHLEPGFPHAQAALDQARTLPLNQADANPAAP